MGKGYLQFSAGEARMGPNKLYNPNQWFVDTQNQREDVQALQMRTIIRQNYAPAQLFLNMLKYKGINLLYFQVKIY